MTVRRVWSVIVLTAAAAALITGVLSAQGPARFPLPLEPIGDSGEAVFPVYEGWGEARDGSGYYIVLGYKNRNNRSVDVPIGPNNRIEPGGPDMGQPTTFEPGRRATQFAIKVPRDFGQKKLTWTIVANNQTASITFYLNREYNMSLYREEANGNDPPQMKFAANAPMLIGPNVGFAQELTGVVNQPVPLKMWASDVAPTEKNWENIVSAQNRPKSAPPAKDQIAIVGGQVLNAGGTARPSNSTPPPDITAVWSKYRGPGTVTIAPRGGVPLVTGGNPSTVAEAAATATFSASGEYWLRAEPVEADDGFDGLCCFSFALVKVTVK
ncbi:MAG: hypothetical protein QM736_00400 [Vicinamibacterales bacterium]